MPRRSQKQQVNFSRGYGDRSNTYSFFIPRETLAVLSFEQCVRVSSSH
ncbi:hypothetical protein [Chlorogloeopsis sp. ULAP02]